MIPQFECHKCGSCCRRIIVTDGDYDVSVGMCLMPEERKLFKSYPGSILPYIGLQKKGRSKISVMFYQMVHEPCPLLDPDTNLCMNYDNRPFICRGYPFSRLLNGVSVDRKCKYIMANFEDAKWGETKVQIGQEQITGVQGISSRMLAVEARIMANQKLRSFIFDSNKREWRGKQSIK